MKKIISLLFLAGLCCISFQFTYADTPYQSCADKITLPLEIWSSGWSNNYQQQRIYNEQQTGLSVDDLNDLKVAWTFVFDDTVRPRSVPAITSQTIFIGSQEGAIFALNTKNGCGYWRFQADNEVRTAISVAHVKERWLVFFGDNDANAYAVDAATGKLVWKTKMDEHKAALITGSPVFYNNNLYVPVSSLEVVNAMNPFYGCCTFRGSLLSVDALTGSINWKTYTIKDPAKKTYRNKILIHQYGASGSPIWSAPTIDEKRQRIYVGTGQNYSDPANETSNAIIAFDIKSGDIAWVKQTYPNDTWNAACPMMLLKINCPKQTGVDFDFGAAPLLVTRSDGKDIIIAGQKSANAYALDPDDKGNILWERDLGAGGLLGGIHWGLAANKDFAYIPVSDVKIPYAEENEKYNKSRKPGLSKIDIFTGKTLWHSSTLVDCKDECRHGLSAAITGIPGAILAGSLDGKLRAYSTETGEVKWLFDSNANTIGVNGLEGHGSTLDAGGVVITHGMMFFNSGYGGFLGAGGKEGNVFWVLKKS